MKKYAFKRGRGILHENLCKNTLTRESCLVERSFKPHYLTPKTILSVTVGLGDFET